MSDTDSVHSGDHDDDQTTASTLVVTKYKMAAEICNEALTLVLKECVEGKKCGELCDIGDKFIYEKTLKVFKKDKKNEVRRGIAFPTCVSVNNVICHFSPLRDEEDTTLKNGDVVKVDLGAHIDGFIATAAHTIVVGASPENKVTGKKADIIWGAYTAMEAAIRMLKAGAHKNMEVTDTISRVAHSFKVTPIENMLSHQLLKDKIDGEKQIIQNPVDKKDMEKCDFEVHDVFAVDILVSSGEGKAREVDRRPTVYKKADDIIYQLKLKHSRAFLAEVLERHGNMPFTLRTITDPLPEKTPAAGAKAGGDKDAAATKQPLSIATARMGVKECVEHGLMKVYPVLSERDGEFVAQFKCTVLIMPNGLLKIAGLPAPDAAAYSTEHKIEDEKLANLLKTSLKPSKKAKKKAKTSGKENEKAEEKKPANAK